MPIKAPHHKTGHLQQVYRDMNPDLPQPAKAHGELPPTFGSISNQAAALERVGQLEDAMPLWQQAAGLAKDLRNRSWAILRAEHCQRHAKNPPLYLRPKPQEEAAA